MKDGLHVTSLYRPETTKSQRSWITVMLCACALVLFGAWMLDQGKELERQEREVYTNVATR